LVQRFRFRFILATAFNSIDYSQKSIEIPSGRVRRKRQRLSSNGFIESAPEHRAPAHFFSKARFR
jgi:hypothetical protein